MKNLTWSMAVLCLGLFAVGCEPVDRQDTITDPAPVVVPGDTSDDFSPNAYDADPAPTTDYPAEPAPTTEFPAEPAPTTEFPAEPAPVQDEDPAADLNIDLQDPAFEPAVEPSVVEEPAAIE